MSSYRTVVRRSDSWDVNFYLLVISDVSTRHRRWRGNQVKSVTSYARHVSLTYVVRTNHKSGDTGFWKPLDSWVSDSYSEPKLDLYLMDTISFYSRDRTPLYLFPSETYETRVSRQQLVHEKREILRYRRITNIWQNLVKTQDLSYEETSLILSISH